MEEIASLWNPQESIDELKLKIYYTALEVEVVKAKANEEMTQNTESIKQLLHLLKLVCHERDEARDQTHKLLNKIMPLPSTNKSLLPNCFDIDQVQPHPHYPLMNPAKPNTSFAESNSLSDAYNHSSSPVNPLFDPVTYPEFSTIHANTSFVQDYRVNHHVNHQASLLIESMVKGKALPQKGNLLNAVIKASRVLQSLFPTNSQLEFVRSSQITMATKHSGQLLDMSCDNLCFYDGNCGNVQERMGTCCPRVSNFGPSEKRQRFK